MGDREKRGQEVYRMQEKWWREAGLQRWREVGEKGGNATLQSRKCKEAGADKYKAGTGNKR